MFKKLGLVLLSLPLLAFSKVPYQDDALERSYLVEVINQIESMKSLIQLADQAKMENASLVMHYRKYKDNRGQMHAGLLDDINQIELGIQERLTRTPTLRVYQPIKGDYVERVRA